ncbi:MAG: bifunctional glutamate N-acetyltransferase/amino-acid acetyltransferase ArgJ [Anaerolineae bacterium]|nr:bifunctional glutamate N-acetyltransferase/amino-acid acetyltransferase ArgJ [Anaerolineae bacterium]
MSQVHIGPITGGSLTSVPGFKAAGVACGLKPAGALDLALISTAQPCVAAAVFTTNAFKAAPVLYDQALLAHPEARISSVIINSGCANACTGEEGLQDTRATAQAVAQALGIKADQVAVMSTGVIGMRLPMAKIFTGIEKASQTLSSSTEAGHAAARAIMTTDTHPKEFAVRVQAGSWQCTIAGMAKGAGMIHPNMATMLCVLATDAALTPQVANQALREAVEESFHRITVDGDTSTNDTVLLMANGLSESKAITSLKSPEYGYFLQGLKRVATELAKAIVRDGEGATHFVEITVQGARTPAEAKQVGMSVARSPLVKTAIYGEDANWGRIICAVGYSGVPIEPEKVRLWLGDLELVRGGKPYHIDEERASQLLSQRDISIIIDLGMGQASTTVWTCDLSHEYVNINAHYRT